MAFITNYLFFIAPLLVAVAYTTLMERNVLGPMGLRLGPNKVSLMGLLQPVVDALKLASKSLNYANQFMMYLYYMPAIFMIFLSVSLWANTPIIQGFIMWKFSIIFMMFLMSILTMKSIFTAWSIKTKFPLMGSMRSVSQMISYESVVYLCLLVIAMTVKGFSLSSIFIEEMEMMFMVCPVVFFFWKSSILAELSRTPYDYSESESELVSGFNTELGSVTFTLAFLSEYANILMISYLTAVMFFSIKIGVLMMAIASYLVFFTIWVRGTLPRIRFDKFMEMAWKFYIPLMTIALLFQSNYTI